MSLKIYRSFNVLVHDDSENDKVFHYPIGRMWYSFNQVLKTFSVYLLNPEVLIANELLYTAFQKIDGDTFDSNTAVMDYLDDLIARINKDYAIEVVESGGQSHVLTSNMGDETLKKLALELEKMNMHLSLMTDETIEN